MSRGAHSTPVALVICGEPAVGRALALLLRDSRYDAEFLPAAPLGERGSLEGVRLLVLTPTSGWSTGGGKTLLKPLRERAAAAGIPVLELAASSAARRDGSGRLVPWPCDIEELRRRIEEALRLADKAGAEGAALRGPLASWERKEEGT